MKTEIISFNYEAEIRGNPLRYKKVENIKNIILGNIKTAEYYIRYGDYKDARIELKEAYKRIDIFAKDIKNESLDVNILEINSLRELVKKAEVELFGKSELISNQNKLLEEVLTA